MKVQMINQTQFAGLGRAKKRKPLGDCGCSMNSGSSMTLQGAKRCVYKVHSRTFKSKKSASTFARKHGASVRKVCR